VGFVGSTVGWSVGWAVRYPAGRFTIRHLPSFITHRAGSTITRDRPPSGLSVTVLDPDHHFFTNGHPSSVIFDHPSRDLLDERLAAGWVGWSGYSPAHRRSADFFTNGHPSSVIFDDLFVGFVGSTVGWSVGWAVGYSAGPSRSVTYHHSSPIAS
jgi:hypothetical protein